MMVFILLFRHMHWIFCEYNKSTLCGIVIRLNNWIISSHLQAERTRNIFFLFLIFHPRVMFLILCLRTYLMSHTFFTHYTHKCWNQVPFQMFKSLDCQNWVCSKMAYILSHYEFGERWWGQENFEEEDDGVALLQEVGGTRSNSLGTKYSGFILKEETLKLAKPDVYLLKVSSCCENWWEASFIVYRGIVSLVCVKHLCRQRHIQTRLLYLLYSQAEGSKCNSAFLKSNIILL